ncbi:MAG: hypothetical protein K8T10_04840 [Candidatus Eremiobacteraeota bacterium]|nr:hypothetical protein [Candidatus Eremiobacteraeota bacterium]
MKEPPILWEEEIEVRYVETDQMGVVHHTYVLIYFEIARTALFKNFIKSVMGQVLNLVISTYIFQDLTP